MNTSATVQDLAPWHILPPRQFLLDLGAKLIVDLFAGGGGASTGIEQAIGRPVDIAVNHDALAVAQHLANHPQTRHYCADVFEVDPVVVTEGRPVGLLWASPSCTHFSKARGGKPVNKQLRSLAWVVIKWCKLPIDQRPSIVCLENVEEWKDWGPLNKDGQPCEARKGLTFRRWVRQLETLGYVVEYKELRASDYDTPTIRNRLFLIARCDGLPIVWPAATHAKAPTKGSGLKPWRTAAECIDFSLPAQSIFDRKRALVKNTHRRVAKGLWRHVLDTESPYIVDREESALTPFLSEHANSSNQRTMRADEPLRTQCAQVKGGHFSIVTPTLAVLRGTSEAHLGAHSIEDPVTTLSAGGTHHALVMAFMEQANGGFYGGDGRSIKSPLSTITTTGSNQQLVTAYCVKYYSNGGQWQGLDEPMHTLPTKGRIGLVKVRHVPANLLTEDQRHRARQCAELLHEHLSEEFPEPAEMVLIFQRGHWWVLVDITLRMLKPRELYKAQGFPSSYIIDWGIDLASGQRIELTQEQQVKSVGNSVCPPLAKALVAANYVERSSMRTAA